MELATQLPPGLELTREELNPDLLDCLAEAGITIEDLNKNLSNPGGMNEMRRLTGWPDILGFAKVFEACANTFGPGNNPEWEKKMLEFVAVVEKRHPLGLEEVKVVTRNALFGSITK